MAAALDGCLTYPDDRRANASRPQTAEACANTLRKITDALPRVFSPATRHAPKGSMESEPMLSQSRAGKAPAVSQREITVAVATALRSDPRSDKELARDADAIPRTVRAWRDGENLPSLPSFFRLCWELPELRAQALRWLESERTLDPDHERATLELLRAASLVLERRQRALEERGPPE